MASRVSRFGLGLLAVLLAASCAGDGVNEFTDAADSPPVSATIEQSPSHTSPAEGVQALERLPAEESRPVEIISAIRQRDLLDRMRFEIEVLKDSLRRDEEMEREERYRYVALTRLSPSLAEEMSELAEEVDKRAPEITVPHLRDRYQSEITDALRDMLRTYAAKHPR